MINFINRHLDNHSDKYKKVFRFLVSGGTAAFLDLLLLHILVEYIHVWYIFSAIIAYMVAFFASFVLQKFWTFRDMSRHNIHIQMILHFCLGLVNLVINTIALYILVDHFYLHYMLSQILISGVLAIVSFFIYKFFIFKTVSETIL